jgi:hypothetical protein
MKLNGAAQQTQPASRTIRPHLPPMVVGKLTAFIETKLSERDPSLAKSLRLLNENWKSETWALELRATALVLADLIDQGWTVLPEDNQVILGPPGLQVGGETVEEAKQRLRKSLQLGRERQLTDPSVSRFVERLSRPAKHNGHVSSIFDLVDDGATLASELSSLSNLPRGHALARLREIIRPVVEICDYDARCPDTGIRLLDIWRYFRHTWSLEYRSIPGRQLPLLIRNAARPHRPIIGIAMLSSPVLRTRPRDNWIGWTPQPFLDRVRSGEWNAKSALKALARRIDQSVREIRSDDLASPAELRRPTERVVFRLGQKGAGAAAKRELQLREEYSDAMRTRGTAKSQSDPSKRSERKINWRKASEDLLFVRKRAETLSQLLDAKRVFLALDWKLKSSALLDSLLSSVSGERALSVALQEVRKAALSSQIADLSICGAVAPYNILLGGKLVALAVTSKEVRRAWKKRYQKRVSIISSQMAGKPVRRPADLKVITTTSLYGSGSSQYNRLRLKAAGYRLKADIVWEELERTAGYGTVHLSPTTAKILRYVAERQFKARRVNNRFGEGTSPRLRQIRDGLEVLGIKSDDVLHHATPRLFYGCTLGKDTNKQLLGLIASKNVHANSLDAIAEAWRDRWLLQRLSHGHVLEALKASGPATVRSEMLRTDAQGQFVMHFVAA